MHIYDCTAVLDSAFSKGLAIGLSSARIRGRTDIANGPSIYRGRVLLAAPGTCDAQIVGHLVYEYHSWNDIHGSRIVAQVANLVTPKASFPCVNPWPRVVQHVIQERCRPPALFGIPLWALNTDGHYTATGTWVGILFSPRPWAALLHGSCEERLHGGKTARPLSRVLFGRRGLSTNLRLDR